MIAHRIGDGGWLALRPRQIAADEALQFREFADHAGDEIGLAQFGRAAGVVGVAIGDDRLDRQPFGQ